MNTFVKITQPVTVLFEGELSVQAYRALMAVYMVDGKISCIKLLRLMYPGCGLFCAKETIERLAEANSWRVLPVAWRL